MEDWENCCSLQFASLQSVFVAHREGTRIQEMYENVHPNLVLVLLFVRTEVECRSVFHGFTGSRAHRATKGWRLSLTR